VRFEEIEPTARWWRVPATTYLRTLTKSNQQQKTRIR